MNTCDVCKKDFTRLRQHMINMHPDIASNTLTNVLLIYPKMNTCDVCKKDFTRLRQHMINMHPDIASNTLTRVLLSKEKTRKDAKIQDNSLSKMYIQCILPTKAGKRCVSTILEKG